MLGEETMKRILKKTWSFLLAAVMVAGLLPSAAFPSKAAENEEKVIVKEVRTWEELCDAFTLDNTLIDQGYTQKVVLMNDLSKNARDCTLSDTRMVWINVNMGNYILDFNGHTLSGTDDVSSTDLESSLSDFIKIQLYYETKLTFTDSVGGGGIRMYSSRAYDNQLSALHIISLGGDEFNPSTSVVFDGGEYSLTAKTSKFGTGTTHFDILYRGCVVVDAVNATVNDGIFTAKSEGIVSKGDDMCARELSAFATCITDYSARYKVVKKGKVQTGYTVINGGMFESDGYSIHHFDDAQMCGAVGDFKPVTALDRFGYCLYPTINGGLFRGPMGFTGKTFTYSDGSDEVNDRPASEIIKGENVIGRDGDNDIFDHIREMTWEDLHELNYCFVLGEEVVGYEVTPESEGTEEGYELLERYDSESDVFEMHYRTPIWFEKSGLSLSPTITVDNKETAGDEKEYPVSRKLLNWSDYYKGPVLVKTKLALHGITGDIAFTKDYKVKLSSGMPRLDPPTITTWDDNELRWNPVENAKSYIVELEYYTQDGDDKVYGTPIIRTTSETVLYLPNFLFTKDMMVKASVTAVPASGTGYSDSRPAETEELAGWYNKQTLENVQLDGGILTWELLDPIGSRIYSWVVTVKDSNGTIVDSIKYDMDTTSANLGADFAKNGIAQGDYTVSLHAEVFGPVSTTWTGEYSHQSYAVTANSPSNGSYKVLLNGTEVNAAPAGSWITIRLSPDAGYTVDQVNLSGAGSGSLTVSDNEAEFMMPKGDVGINVSFKEAESYTVTDDCANCRVIPTNGSYLVSSGSSFSFRIEPDAYYEIVPSKFWVDVFAMIDGEGQGLDVIEEDGVYTVENVTTNLEISRSTNGLIGYADIVIGPGDGQGRSITKKLYQGEKLTLTDPVSDPEYGFTAPEGYEFKEWKITYPNGNIKTGAVGRDLNISSGEYQLKAIWKPLYQIDVINGAAYKDAERAERIFRASEDTTVYLDYFPVEGEKVFDGFVINKNNSSSILRIDQENRSFTMVSGDVELEATYVTMIDTVEVQNVVKPADGVVFEEYQETVEETAGYAKGYVTWYDITAENSLNDGESFIGNHTYQISIMLSEKEGYEFDSADKMNLVLAGIPESDYQVISVEATGSDYMKFVVEMMAAEKPVAVEGIQLQESMDLNVAESAPVAYEILPADATNRRVIFVSDNSSVASVDYTTGVVRGIGEGTAVITATTEDGEFQDTCQVIVTCEHNPDREYPTPKDPVKCTLCGKELEPALYQIDEIPDLIYTGKAQKPAVNVYHEGVLLKAGKDYTLTYVNNKDANAVGDGDARMEKTGDGVFPAMEAEGFNPELPYVIVSGKTNYQRDVYVNFNITAPVIGDGTAQEADDVVLKYTDHTEANGKMFKPFTSIKYGKLSMKAGVDYEIKVTKADAPEVDLLNSKGQMEAVAGTYKLTIRGLGSFDGEIVKTISVAEKAALLKNAKIKLNVKSKEFDYKDLDANGTTLDPTDYLVTIKDGTITKELQKDVDFDVSYLKNDRIGTATLVLQGKGSYVGMKTINFKITGTKLTAKNVEISNISDQPYTGKSIEQNAELVLKLADGSTVDLVKGTDYTVSYKNNVKKGTATVTFTGMDTAGYTGSIKSTFKIIPVTLNSRMLAPIDAVLFSKAGAVADDQIILTHAGIRLVKGTDYTLKYTNNKDVGEANVVITGKGNFTGTLNQTFMVVDKPIANTVITVKPLAFKATEGYVYKPSVTVKDGKSTLKAGTDYTVDFVNPSRSDLEAWFAGDTSKAPKLRILAKYNSGYSDYADVEVNIYNCKLSSSNAYVKVDDSENIYSGSQQIPGVKVYYSADKAVIKELKDAEKAGTVSAVIAEKLAAGDIKELTEGTDYTVSGGKNILAGLNKGTVKVTGTGTYSGSVSAKFSIQRKDIWWYELIESLVS